VETFKAKFISDDEKVKCDVSLNKDCLIINFDEKDQVLKIFYEDIREIEYNSNILEITDIDNIKYAISCSKEIYDKLKNRGDNFVVKEVVKVEGKKNEGAYGILTIIVGIVIYLIVSHISTSTPPYSVERHAYEDVPKLAYVFTSLLPSELECKGSSITSDKINLVKCTTTNRSLINYYGSSTIWYGYLESVNTNNYYRAADKDKNVVLSKLRK